MSSIKLFQASFQIHFKFEFQTPFSMFKLFKLHYYLLKMGRLNFQASQIMVAKSGPT